MGHVGVVVLTGGTGRRLGGADKAGLVVSGRTLLDRALGAVAPLGPVVVVGPPAGRVDGLDVTFVREDPPGGGPAAALLAGVAALDTGADIAVDTVVALAVDMPLVTTDTLERLVGSAEGRDGAVLVDGDGRQQYLCAAYSTRALLAAAPADTDGLPLRRLLYGLTLAEVAAVGDEARDVDTAADLDAVRRLARD